MVDPVTFIKLLHASGVDFFAGVPDSLLKNLCACVDDILPRQSHIITANEGGAVAVAVGQYLTTGKIPVVYLQNSGLGNVVNPLTSLTDKEVYGIPLLLIVGWRGEPGIADEPQHKKQGPITPSLLDCLGIPYSIMTDQPEDVEPLIKKALTSAKESNTPYVLLIKKGTFEKYEPQKLKDKTDNLSLTREDVLREVLSTLPKDAVCVGTTGKLSRELFELRVERGEGHERDFLSVGSMGHASQIALGIAEAKPERLVVCLDGDGSALMHMGGMVTIGGRQPQNFLHIIMSNGVHESVGGQPVTGGGINFADTATKFGYKNTDIISNSEQLKNTLDSLLEKVGPNLIDCRIKPGSRDDLGRPTILPAKNKKDFMNFLRK